MNIQKSVQSKNSCQLVSAMPSDDDLEKIYNYTRGKIDKNKLYVFNVTLCDNEVDRDFEKFSLNALNQLAKNFVGKTGIFDHSMKSSDQMARIFDCQVVTDESITTQSGEPYCYLFAKAYMLRCEKNNQLIEEIEAGIKKEVSVGCSVAKKTCSICGKSVNDDSCNHIFGKSYGDKIAYGVLDEVVDAYEWSFVAVPAQRLAGVTKSFVPFNNDESCNITDIIKCFNSAKNEVTLTKSQMKTIVEYLEKNSQLAKCGQCYIEDLQKKAINLANSCSLDFELSVITDVVKKMDISQLKSFINTLENECETSIVQTYSTQSNVNGAIQSGENFSSYGNENFLI